MTTRGEKVAHVLRAGQTRKHHCHWPGCTQQVPPAKWSCRPHWYALPRYLRNKIWDAYEIAQEVSMTPSNEYLDVMHEVQAWIAANSPPTPSSSSASPSGSSDASSRTARTMVVAFTGHRPNKLGGYHPNPLRDFVVSALRKKLEELRPTFAISGMALGVDTWAAELCVELKIPFIAALPFEKQCEAWPEESQRRWYDLLKLAHRVHVVSPGEYAANKMQIRNRWMVDHATDLIAVWDGTPGGTANCVGYAWARNSPLHHIDVHHIDPRLFVPPPPPPTVGVVGGLRLVSLASIAKPGEDPKK